MLGYLDYYIEELPLEMFGKMNSWSESKKSKYMGFYIFKALKEIKVESCEILEEVIDEANDEGTRTSILSESSNSEISMPQRAKKHLQWCLNSQLNDPSLSSASPSLIPPSITINIESTSLPIIFPFQGPWMAVENSRTDPLNGNLVTSNYHLPCFNYNYLPVIIFRLDHILNANKNHLILQIPVSNEL